MITVNFPAALHALAGPSLVVRESVSTIGQLIQAMDRLAPGLARELDDPLYNIAVNDEILLHSVDARSVKDGDVVEVIPSMAGG
jgi:molybdopterin converting factor small subunit